METNYQKIIEFMFVSGKRLLERSGNIADIGITKKDLTEEDIAIERGFKDIITSFGEDFAIYAEEEHDMFKTAKNVWTIDPISGTKNFIAGLPRYSIVIAHLVEGEAVFAAVYDPSVDEMFTAYRGKGAFLNGKSIKVKNDNKKILFRVSEVWKGSEVVNSARLMLKEYILEENNFSMAVNYCLVASGKYDGIVSFTKDSFPEFAGGFILREAGGNFTNKSGESNISAADRFFIGGEKGVYDDLFLILSNISI